MLFLLLLGLLLSFGYFLFLTLDFILFPTFVSHGVTPFRLPVSFRCEECSRTDETTTRIWDSGLRRGDDPIEFVKPVLDEPDAGGEKLFRDRSHGSFIRHLHQ